jgi:hypothetical protein
MFRNMVTGAAAVLLVLGATALADAQPYGPAGPYGPPPGARWRIVQSEPAVVCQNQQDLRRVLMAYTNGNRFRAREAAESCAILTAGTRVVIMDRPTSLNVWQFQTRQAITYRDVLVRVLSGPSRGYLGYIAVDAIR